MVKFIIKTSIFLLIILFVGMLVTAAAWAMWIIFVTWVLDNEFDRVIIMATSAFWIITGGVTWGILHSKKN